MKGLEKLKHIMPESIFHASYDMPFDKTIPANNFSSKYKFYEILVAENHFLLILKLVPDPYNPISLSNQIFEV